jgi:DNA-binding transcriptional ArsR family regulator
MTRPRTDDSTRRREVLDPAQRLESLLTMFAHPLRAAILAYLIERPCSPTEITARLGTTVGVVDYHIRRLEAAGLATFVEKQRPQGKRGYLQNYYVAKPLCISDEEWMTIPFVLRDALTDAVLREFAARVSTSASKDSLRDSAAQGIS